MMHKSEIFAVVTALLILALLSPAAHADQNQALIYAIRKSDVKQVQELLKEGADVNAKDGDGSPALVLAAESDYRGRRELVKLLLEKGADVNAKTKGGWTSLMEAALRGHVELVNLLMDKGADVNAKANNGDTALMTAADRGNLNVVKLLVEKGADVRTKDSARHTALSRAAASNREDVVKFLKDRGAGLQEAASDSTAPKSGKTQDLPGAVQRGDLIEVARVLDRGADVNAKDEVGKTPLMKAAQAGSLEVVKLLLDRGAAANAKDEYGKTALGMSAFAGRLDIVKLLLDEGADVDAGDMNSLMYRADRDDLEIARRLLDRGADVNAKAPWGTALTKACEKGHLSTASLLLDRGAEVNAKDQNGQTPLMKAAEADHLHVVRLLVKKGADINAKDESSGETSLNRAARKGHTAIAELLLNKGADVNATDKSGVTALMTAAESGQLKTAHLLLDRGAQLSVRDEKGRTALEHAASGKHRRVVDLLISRGAKTHLAAAAMVGDTALVQRFLKEGANVNAKDDKGKTALILAVERNHPEVVKLLLENHADVNVKASGETALDIAQQGLDIAQRGSNEIYTVLRSNGAKTSEGLRILKYADKVLRRGDELFFRLADGRITSRKDSPDQESASRVHREFTDFIEPWYVIDESYYECPGGQLLHRDSGQSTTVARNLYFSPDNARFIALACPDESGYDEIWKMTNSGPVKEYVLKPGAGNSFRWGDPSTVEVLISHGASDETVVGRFTLDAATGKWSCSEKDSKKSEKDSEEMGTEKMCREATDDLDLALKDAVDEGDLEALKMLLEKGANLNANGEYWTELALAAWKGHLEIVKLLLAKGAGTSEPERAKAVSVAAMSGHKEVVALLISHGAELTLPEAAAIGDLKAIKKLIKGGADVNAENKDHASAFSNAVHCNQWDAAVLLLKNGVEIEGAYGDAALLTAAAKDGHSGMVCTLLKKEPVAKETLLPALDMAAAEGKLEIVQLLLSEGADVNGRDKHGRTPLMAAAIKGQQATAEFLLKKGADANARDLDRATPLMDAAWGGNPQVVKLLLQKGSAVNATDLDGRTAMQYAKLSRNEEIVELLKAHGAKE